MKKFISPEQPPEGLERELLTIFIEECSEAQQRATKILRFGLNEVQPNQPLSNKTRLSLEIGDLLEMIDQCSEMGLIDSDVTVKQKDLKRKKLKVFLQNQ